MLKNKKKVNKIVNILFVICMLIIFVYYLFDLLNQVNWEIALLIKIWPRAILMLFLLLFLKHSFLIGTFIVIKLAFRDSKKELKEQEYKLDETLHYFREILKGISPSIIDLVNDYEIDEKRSIVSILLNLKLKKIIDITNDNIIINNQTNKKLSQVEQVVLEMLLTKSFNSKSKRKELNDYIVKEAYDCDFFHEHHFTLKYFGKRAAKFIYLSCFVVVINIVLFLIKFLPLIDLLPSPLKSLFKIIHVIFIIFLVLGLFIGFSFLIFFAIIYLFFYSYSIKNRKYYRTEKGEMLNNKIKGLKNFLVDFSNIQKKELKDLSLWDEYLIYSVIFGKNDKIVDKIYDIIKRKFIK